MADSLVVNAPIAVPPLIAQVLRGRGMAESDMASFIAPDYGRDLHDPFLMLDMDRAVARIKLAQKLSQSVVIYGDYDIDGITASAVMLEALTSLGIQARSYIPDRFEEGYGLNQAALERLLADGTELVISVDCGITSVAEAAWAREHGLDLIITDHHNVPTVLPEAVAVVNPKRPGDRYPFKDLAGVGVAFCVVRALQRELQLPVVGQEKWLLDLVALGTVCDVVPLLGENRTLVTYGLQVLRQTRRLGLRALAVSGGVDIESISAHHLGFVLGPRMNAAGRLEHAARSVELVMTADAERAGTIARELEALNKKRRSDQEAIFVSASERAEAYCLDPIIVVADEKWSHGVVGIVASKLVEKWQKPALVAQVMGDVTKGSARSVPGVDIVDALRSQSTLLSKFGGHYFAGGFTLPTRDLDAFRQGLIEHLDKTRGERLQSVSAPALIPDVTLDDLTDVDWPLLEQLEMLAPLGSGNPPPLFEIGGLVLRDCVKMGKEGQHWRMVLADATNRTVKAVGFGMVSRNPDLSSGRHIIIRGELNKNEYMGNRSVQVIIRELDYE